MRYLLDSDWAIEYLRGSDRFIDRIASLLPLGIGISIISVAELYDDVAAARDQTASELELIELLNRLGVLGVDQEIAQIFGAERHRLRGKGEPIGDMDLLIAATALRHDLTLLTNNRRHFNRIPDLTVESV
jgi:predicted nucleic acid-binding protein